ncbi:hypothetical protein MRX96_000722 [Rhipicephalus microplus]
MPIIARCSSPTARVIPSRRGELGKRVAVVVVYQCAIVYTTRAGETQTWLVNTPHRPWKTVLPPEESHRKEITADGKESDARAAVSESLGYRGVTLLLGPTAGWGTTPPCVNVLRGL